MACACKSTLPREVPARDVGLRSSLKVGYSQLAAADNAERATRARPAFAASRNPSYLGVVHAGGPRDARPVKTGLSFGVLVVLGGAAWALTRGK